MEGLGVKTPSLMEIFFNLLGQGRNEGPGKMHPLSLFLVRINRIFRHLLRGSAGNYSTFPTLVPSLC